MKISSLAIATILSIHLLGQKRFELMATIGYNNPIGDFGCKTCYKGGYADKGEVINVSIRYSIHKNLLGICNLNYQHNPLNKADLTHSYKVENPSYSWYVESNNYNSYGSHLGIGYNFKFFNSKIQFVPKFLIGLENINMPSLTAYPNHSIFGSSSITILGRRSFTHSFLMGSDLSYNLNNSIAIVSHIDFFSAQKDFSNVRVEYSTGEIENTNYGMNVMSINYGIGVKYILGQTK